VTMKQPGRAHLRPLEPFEAASPEAARLSWQPEHLSALLAGSGCKIRYFVTAGYMIGARMLAQLAAPMWRGGET
jgi:hypothetical protein